MPVDEFGRKLGWVPQEVLDAPGGSDNKSKGSDIKPPPNEGEENLVCSYLDTTGEIEDRQRLHRPVIDIDFPARLLPSSTPGHFHLYLDGALIPHDTYMYLLTAFEKAGIISEGYLKYSLDRGYTAVRTPGNFKPVRERAEWEEYAPKHMKPAVKEPEDLEPKKQIDEWGIDDDLMPMKTVKAGPYSIPVAKKKKKKQLKGGPYTGSTAGPVRANPVALPTDF